jgi:hypothetical protein
VNESVVKHSPRKFISTNSLVSFGFITLAFISLISLLPLFGKTGELLPEWFLYMFIPTALGFVSICIIQAALSFRTGFGGFNDRRNAVISWVLIFISFPINSSVHQFYALRGNPLRGHSLLLLLQGKEWLSPNELVIYGGAFLIILFAFMFFKGLIGLSLAAVSILAYLILIPTCNCANPFNSAWNEILGASPMMFVPSSFTIFCAVRAMSGVNVRVNFSLIAVTLVGTLLLGIGHMTRVVW